MENNRFEDSFKNAFAGAEVSPSSTVWTNIELDLEKASGGKLKRNLLMFQLLAAASVAFAFGVTALYYLEQPVKKDGFVKEALSGGGVSPSNDSAESSTLLADESEAAKTVTKKQPVNSITKQLKHQQTPGIVSQPVEGQVENSVHDYKVTRTDLASLVKVRKPVLILPKTEEPVEPDAGMVLLAQLKDEEKKYRDEEKKAAGSHEKIWASVGFGAGSYKPNVQSSSASLNATGMAGAPSTESVTGASYSVGVSMAGRLSKRVILQGGISYLTQSADFTSTFSNQGAVSLNEFMKPANFDAFAPETPYVVNSNMQFVSIPVQAGYLIVDRAIGVQLNGGFSTDLFVSSTLSPESDNYQKVTQSAGKDSPYRTVNFSGLLGTEFSYRIADHYRISLNPGLRYSLNSIYKEEVAAEITPVTFDVSLRFRYIFK